MWAISEWISSSDLDDSVLPASGASEKKRQDDAKKKGNNVIKALTDAVEYLNEEDGDDSEGDDKKEVKSENAQSTEDRRFELLENYHGIPVVLVDDISGAATVPEVAIFIDKAWYNRMSAREQEKLKQHEYGHYLQWKKFGSEVFWGIIAPASLLSAEFADVHQNSLCERGANTLSYEFFGENSLLGGSDYPIIVPSTNPPSSTVNGVIYIGYPGF